MKCNCICKAIIFSCGKLKGGKNFLSTSVAFKHCDVGVKEVLRYLSHSLAQMNMYSKYKYTIINNVAASF